MKLKKVCLAVCLMMAVLCAAACTQAPAVTVTIGSASETLNVGQSITLTAEASDGGAVEWSSENEAVATVSETGTVTAVSAGTVKIIAERGEASAQCTVTVKDDVSFTVGEAQAALKVGQKLQIAAQLTVNGKEVTAELAYSSSDPSVASASEGIITALKAGSAEITVSCEYGGAPYSAKVSVTVENVVSVSLSQETAELFAYGDGSSLSLAATVTVNGATDEDAQIAWTSSAPDVVSVDGNGLLTGLSAGSAEISAVYTLDGKDYTGAAAVTVKRAAVRCDASYAFGIKAEDLVLKASDFTGTVEEIKNGDSALQFIVSENGENITLAKEQFAETGEITLNVTTNRTTTSVAVKAATFVIRSAADLDKMEEYGAPTTIWPEGTNNYQGYFLLGADIDYGGKVWQSALTNTNNRWNAITFDGQGHTISNIQFTTANYGLFGTILMNGSIVRNLALTGVTVGGANFIGALAQTNEGTVEDLFVSGSITSGEWNSLVTSYNRNSGTMKNVVVVCESFADNKTAALTMVEDDAKYADLVNCYTIGTVKSIMRKSGWTISQPDAGTYPGTVGYAAPDAFKTAVTDLSAFTASVWDCTSGIPLPAGGLDFAIVNTENTVAQNTTLALSATTKFVSWGIESTSPEGVSIDNGTVIVEGDVAAGTKFTVKATSLLDGQTDTMEITVIPITEEELAGEYYLETKADSTLDIGGTEGTVTSVLIDGESVAFEAEGSVLTIPAAAAADKTPGTAYTIMVYTDAGYRYTGQVLAVTKAIRTAADLDKMEEYGAPASIGTTNDYKGYFVLAADIDYSGKVWQSALVDTSNRWNTITFDGQGHTISNIQFTTTNYGLFGTILLPGCTVSDFALTGVTVGGANFIGAITLTNQGAIENVFVSGSITSGQFTTLSAVYNKGTMENVIVVCESFADNKTAALTMVEDLAKIADTVNCYTIGTVKSIMYKSGWNVSQPDAGTYPETVGYTTAEAFLADSEKIFAADKEEFNAVFTYDEAKSEVRFYGKPVITL